MKFSIPSKTFLIGEYLALKGGPALVIATQPLFEFKVQSETSDFKINGIHEESPAGKLLYDHKNLLSPICISFKDPHQNQGGFGASSAQFLASYQYILKILKKPFFQDEFTKIYRKYHQQGSGADILAQLYGYITLFQGLEKKPTIIKWPFEDLGFLLIRTGFKVPTHIHIDDTSLFEKLPFDMLRSFVNLAIVAMENKDEKNFIESIKKYSNLLKSFNLLYEPVIPLICNWSKKPGVMAVKGCGALGADVILVIYKKNVFLKSKDFSFVATNSDLSQGFKEQE